MAPIKLGLQSRARRCSIWSAIGTDLHKLELGDLLQRSTGTLSPIQLSAHPSALCDAPAGQPPRGPPGPGPDSLSLGVAQDTVDAAGTAAPRTMALPSESCDLDVQGSDPSRPWPRGRPNPESDDFGAPR